MKLLNFTENATYSIEADGMPKIIMRVHRLDYAKLNTIRTELQWLLDLKKETNLSLATPIPSTNGLYVETIDTPEMKEERNVVCFEFAKGSAPKDSSDSNEGVGNLISKIDKIPDKITIPLFKKAAVLYAQIGKLNSKSPLTDADRKLYQQVGAIAASIHKQSKSWSYPAFYERMEWNFDGTFGKKWNNFYGVSYRSPKWLSKEDIGILDLCVDFIDKRLKAYGKEPDRYGMIHSDLRTANLLKEGETITVLDFDDCGKGWYMYDIAGAVALMEHRPDLKEIVNEVVNGYQTILPISKEDHNEIMTFILMRRIGMLQSLIGRIGCVMGGSGEAAELTPEILAFYAKGTVVMAKDYIKAYASSIPLPKQSDKDQKDLKSLVGQPKLENSY